MPHAILALDLGTKTGWALRLQGRFEHGVQEFVVKRGESPGMRYVRFNRWLRETGTYATFIAYEAPHHRGGAATEVANGFATRVQEFCAEMGAEHTAVHTATLKKWLTGSGNAKKPEMMAAVAARWCAVETDDEADAIALLHYVETEVLGGQ